MDFAKFYTRARRVPVLIGTITTLGEKRRIPYGPYTVIQFAGVVAVGFVLSKTTALWARAGFAMNLVIALTVLIGVVLALGKVPHVGRNPLTMAMAGLVVLTGPANGTRKGKPLRVRRPHAARVTTVVGARQRTALPAAVTDGFTPDSSTTDARLERAAASSGRQPAAAPTPQLGVGAPALTGVARLLASAPAPTERRQ